MTQPRTETRQRIEETALKLFTEKGYDLTSLREIAEELGVTKAALYYHFKSKEEILESIVSRSDREMQELIDWAAALPKSPESRGLILERISALVDSRWKPMIRFTQVNQARMRSLNAGGSEKRMEQMRRIFGLLYDPEADRSAKFKSALAVAALLLGAVGLGSFIPADSGEDYRDVALGVARSLVD